MLADKKCQDRGLPKGSLWIAPETSRNLSQTAQGVISVCLSPSDSGCPYARGNLRMTELPVEQFFGRLRVQSSSAQLSCPAFWTASARDMLRMKAQKKHSARPPRNEHVDAVSPTEFFHESEKALKACLRLAAWCEGCTTESLQASYFEWASSGKYKACVQK